MTDYCKEIVNFGQYSKQNRKAFAIGYKWRLLVDNTMTTTATHEYLNLALNTRRNTE